MNKNTLESVRVGIVGWGAMGSLYGEMILGGDVPGLVLTAICDVRADDIPAPKGVELFGDYQAMLRSGRIDAVIVNTPHTFHRSMCEEAFEADIHVLVDKPLTVTKTDAEALLAAFEEKAGSGLVFAIMLNQRARPVFRKLKALIDSGDLGEIRRVHWTVTDWFRPEAYYKAGGWRATWKGEGGGVLVNQSPHQIDMIQWLFGRPDRVRAFGTLGRYHDIEVEDDVTAFLVFPNGSTGVFVTSTGEAPGSNRLEIAAERGRVIVEGDTIIWNRNLVETSEFLRTSTDRLGKPETEYIEVDVEPAAMEEHAEVLMRFGEAVRGTGEPVAVGSDGIHQVELTNAMLASLVEGREVLLPMNGGDFTRVLERLIEESSLGEEAAE